MASKSIKKTTYDKTLIVEVTKKIFAELLLKMTIPIPLNENQSISTLILQHIQRSGENSSTIFLFKQRDKNQLKQNKCQILQE